MNDAAATKQRRGNNTTQQSTTNRPLAEIKNNENNENKTK